jgi:hypothetical protein
MLLRPMRIRLAIAPGYRMSFDCCFECTRCIPEETSDHVVLVDVVQLGHSRLSENSAILDFQICLIIGKHDVECKLVRASVLASNH